MRGRRMISRRPATVAAALIALGVAAAPIAGDASQDRKSARPDIELRVTPPVGVAPLRVVTTAEIKGGDNDYEDFYCPRIEWEWADGTTSQSTDDCDPYEAGRSEIRRRYSQQHTYKDAGAYRIIFHVKQGTKQVGAATIRLEVHGY